LRPIAQKKKPSVSVEAGVSVTVLPSRDQGCGLSTPNSFCQVSVAGRISKSGLAEQKPWTWS
jgi:hypothetical protein